MYGPCNNIHDDTGNENGVEFPGSKIQIQNETRKKKCLHVKELVIIYCRM